MARADELLDLIKSPTAVAIGVLVVFASNQMKKNDEGTVNKPATGWALGAALAALAITVAIVIVMIPLAYDVVVTNRGGVETRLLVFWLTFVVAIGTACYAGSIAFRTYKHLR